jgi:hypothetical protein
MATVEELEKEVRRLKRVLAPNEDELLTRTLRGAFKTMNLDDYSYYGREGRGPRYRITQKELAEKLGLSTDQVALYKVGQSLSVLGWRRVTSLGRVYYVIDEDTFDAEFVLS